MKLLLCGFEPFGNDDYNPAIEAVKKVKDKIGSIEIVKIEVPTVFYESIKMVEKKIEEIKPEYVLCIGLAMGRSDMSVERVAINVDDARIKDNAGNKPIDKKIMEEGENAYFSNLPIKAMVYEMKQKNIKASISNSAGTFVCNHLMYGVLHLCNHKYPNMKGGFIHVPMDETLLLKHKEIAYMELNTIVEGLETCVMAIELYENDISSVEGKIH